MAKLAKWVVGVAVVTMGASAAKTPDPLELAPVINNNDPTRPKSFAECVPF